MGRARVKQQNSLRVRRLAHRAHQARDEDVNKEALAESGKFGMPCGLRAPVGPYYYVGLRWQQVVSRREDFSNSRDYVDSTQMSGKNDEIKKWIEFYSL